MRILQDASPALCLRALCYPEDAYQPQFAPCVEAVPDAWGGTLIFQ
jgi:hypothetical protein